MCIAPSRRLASALGLRSQWAVGVAVGRRCRGCMSVSALALGLGLRVGVGAVARVGGRDRLFSGKTLAGNAEPTSALAGTLLRPQDHRCPRRRAP